ncbi:MAG: N-acetylmuramoyl-L-alanine amidase [Bacteroidetes bacterium]|nr:N-acetylmuramoyl-L-alanine amidase [Bacteroidota bacterium]
MGIRSMGKRLVWGLLLVLVATSAKAQMLADVVDTFTGLDNETRVVAGKRTQLFYTSEFVSTPFSGVAVEIGSTDPDPKAFFRFLNDDIWSEWTDAYINRSATGGTLVAGYRQDKLIIASRFEFKVDSNSDFVTVVRNAGVFNNALDQDQRPSGDFKPAIGSKTGSIIPPPLITRAQWSAKPFKSGSPSPLANGAYQFMTMHHAAGYSAETEAQGKAQMLAMQDLHQNVRGWSDIGYQFAIDRGGRLYQGRPFMDNSTSLSQVPVLAMGAHVGNGNTGNIGVVIMGCYHPPEGSSCVQQITPAAYETYKVLFAFLSERYGVAPTLIRGHRDFSTTACPGDNNYVLLPQLRVQVANLLVSGNELIGVGTMTASADAKGRVDLSWSITQDFGIDSLYVERITSLGTSKIVLDALGSLSFTDEGVLGESRVTYLLIASRADGRKQELARIEVEIADPSTYLLTSAFPNPTSTTAQFRYFLSVEGLVTVSLYDALGRQVREWETGFQTEDEWYSQIADVSDLSAGTYFFRIKVSGFNGIAFDKTHPLVVSH